MMVMIIVIMYNNNTNNNDNNDGMHDNTDDTNTTEIHDIRTIIQIDIIHNKHEASAESHRLPDGVGTHGCFTKGSQNPYSLQ